MNKFFALLFMAATLFICVAGHGQNQPSTQPQRVQHPYYQYDGFVESKMGFLLPRRLANFTPKSPVLIYDTATGRINFYTNGWKTLQNVAFSSDYNDLINRPDLTQYVPISRTVNGYPLTSNVVINKVDIGLGLVPNIDATNAVNITSGSLPDARLSANVTLKGNTFNGSNQLLQLDPGGKVPFANLPAAFMIYKGTWDASTNTPALSDGTGVNGWVYRVEVPGTINLGSGNITFQIGDDVIHNGSVWQRSGRTDLVTAVNGQQGAVTLTTANINEGGTNYYYTNSRVQTFADTRYSLLNHEHVFSDIANLSSYTGFDSRYKSISYVPSWSDITSKPVFATVATTGAYSDLTGIPLSFTPSAHTHVTSDITNLSSYTGFDSRYKSISYVPSWSDITSKPSTFIPSAHTHPWADITGTVPTWNQNTTGNAATATTANYWGVVPNSFNSPAETSLIENLIGISSANGYAYKFTAGAVQSWLGLGSNAYTSTAYLPLTGGTLTGSVSASSFATNGYSTASTVRIYTSATDLWDMNTSGNILTISGYNGTFLNSMTLSRAGAATFLSTVTASSFFGAATGLTGTATGLNIGGQALLLGSSGSSLTAQRGNGTVAYDFAVTYPQTGLFPAIDNSNSVLTVNRHPGDYYSQFGFSSNGNLYYRSFNGNAINTSSVWERIITSTNYNQYSPSLTGGGASGTWGINVTGNAATATNTTLWNGQSLDYSTAITTSPTYVTGFVSGATKIFTAPAIQSWLGLGTAAYTSSAAYYAAGTTVANSTLWNGETYNPSASSTIYNFILAYNADGTWRPTTAAATQSWLGLGTAAYTSSSSYEVPLSFSTGLSRSGNTISNTGVTSISGTSNQIAVSAATGSVTVSLTNNVVIPGTITSSASYETSDKRLKKDLGDLTWYKDFPAEKIKSHWYEKDGRFELGYYAQEVQELLNPAVMTGSSGYLLLNYNMVFIAKIQRLEERVFQLEKIIAKGGFQ